MVKIVGIDFGTTSSFVTYTRDDKVEFVEVDGHRRIPSLMYFPENVLEKPLFGRAAQRHALLNPQRTVVAVKKLLGKTYEEVQPFLPQLSYRVSPDAAGFPLIDLGDAVFHPQEVAALFLQYLREQVNDFLGEQVDTCVITVPANFNMRETASAREAFEIAGWKVKRVLAEPTAALMAARHVQAQDVEGEDDAPLLVLDIGGSSTDVSLQRTGDGVYEVLSIAGDNMLGGIDFDFNLVQELVRYFYETEGVQYANDKVALYRLWEAAEKAKIELSSSEHTRIQLPFMSVNGVVKTLEAPLTRSRFEELCLPLVHRCLDLCKKAFYLSGYNHHQLAGYFLVGAASRTPLVKEQLEQYFGKKPLGHLNPEEVVAVGAGIQGGVLVGMFSNSVLLLDIYPFTLNAELPEGLDLVESVREEKEGWRTLEKAETNSRYIIVTEEGTTIPSRKAFRLQCSSVPHGKELSVFLYDSRHLEKRYHDQWKINIPESIIGASGELDFIFSWDIDLNGVQRVILENPRTKAQFKFEREKPVTSLSGQSLVNIRKRLTQRDQLQTYLQQLEAFADRIPAGMHQRFMIDIEGLRYARVKGLQASAERFIHQIDTRFQEFAQKQMIGFDQADDYVKPDETLKKEWLPLIVRHLTDQIDNESTLHRFIQEVRHLTGQQECALFASRLVKIQNEFSLGLIERPTFITETNRIRLGLMNYLEELTQNREISPVQYHNILIFAASEHHE